MKHVRLWLILVGIMVISTGSAWAQEKNLLGTIDNKGVWGRLLDSRCNPMWLGKALSDSGIKAPTEAKPNRLRLLPPGQKVYLNENPCGTRPPAAVVKLSQKILQLDSLVGQAHKPAPKKVVSSELDDLKKKIALLQGQVGDLVKEEAILEKSLADEKLAQALTEASLTKLRNIGLAVWIPLLIVIVLFFTIALFKGRRLGRPYYPDLDGRQRLVQDLPSSRIYDSQVRTINPVPEPRAEWPDSDLYRFASEEPSDVESRNVPIRRKTSA